MLLQQIIDVYQKLITMSYASGLAAPRRFGPDIIDLASKLRETAPPNSQLSLLCDKLVKTTWREYVVNAKDRYYYRDKAYRETLKKIENVWKMLVTIETQWDQELLECDEEGSGDSDEDCGDDFADDEVSDGEEYSDDDTLEEVAYSESGSSGGDESDDESEQVSSIYRTVDISPDHCPAPDLPFMDGKKETLTRCQYAAMAVVAFVVPFVLSFFLVDGMDENFTDREWCL